VNGWGIMLICGMVLWYASTETRLQSLPGIADMTTTVVHSYKLLINDVKPIHSLTHIHYKALIWSGNEFM